MTAKRKTMTMLVTISVPRDMSRADARREVRSLIADQCTYSAEEGDIKVKAIRPAPTPERRRAVQLAFF